jgi:hypothetical protein
MGATTAACSKPPPRRLPQTEPPARVIAATDGRVSFQSSAYVELHTWLAATARTDDEISPELEPAKRAYARSLQDDDGDVLLERTTRSLSTCTDDRCAIAALEPTGFGSAFARALPVFLAKHWLARATASWIGVEASHAIFAGRSGSTEAIFMRVASDLGVAWPDHAVRVDIVSENPPVGRAALMPVALGARGSCFFISRSERRDERVHDARILDCVMVHALRGAHQPSALRVAIVRALGVEEGERAWSVLVVHAVAATVTGWESKHLSAYRRSAMAVEGKILDWLVHEWHGRPDPMDAFVDRYAKQWRELHKKVEEKKAE